jgi:hypothetical protein
MAGPTSARVAEADFLSRRAEAVFAAEADPAVSVVLLMCSFGCGCRSRIKQKPTAVLQPWVLVKIYFNSTSADGVTNYNDDRQFNRL